jgi:hypothetical protein
MGIRVPKEERFSLKKFKGNSDMKTLDSVDRFQGPGLQETSALRDAHTLAGCGGRRQLKAHACWALGLRAGQRKVPERRTHFRGRQGWPSPLSSTPPRRTGELP